jgi:uncharacterized membrane protein YeaQ/YmgE (transglycosylase-associated protein family)
MIRTALLQGFVKVVTCRRTLLGLVGMACCVSITYMMHTDTSGSIALIVTSVAGANAAQAVMSSKKDT